MKGDCGRVMMTVLAVLISGMMTAAVQGQVLPFEDIQYTGDQREVEFDGTWYVLLAIDGREADRIVQYCQEEYGDDWQNALEDKFVLVMAGVGRTVEGTVKIHVRESGSHRPKLLSDVPLSREKWQQLAQARQLSDEIVDNGLPASLVMRDLLQLQSLLDNVWAWSDRERDRYTEQFSQMRKAYTSSVALPRFVSEVMRCLAAAGDAASCAKETESTWPGGYLPFALEKVADQWVAVQLDYRRLFDPDYPYITQIGRADIEHCVAEIQPLIAKGDSLSGRVGGVLRCWGFVEFMMRLEKSDRVQVRLASGEGEVRETQVSLMPHPGPTTSFKPPGFINTHRLLPDQVGYLRLADMHITGDRRRALDDAMSAMRGTRGLVLDVRGNSGERRDLLETLLPYFLSPSHGSTVVNVMACRAKPDQKPDIVSGYLSEMRCYPAANPVWPAQTRQMIQQYAQTFTPSDKLEEAQFSKWHYMAISPKTDEGVYYYDKPVVVLMDEGSGGAAEVLLSWMKTLPRVTLVGRPSVGTDALVRTFKLRHSGVQIQLTTGLSFAPGGELITGRGVSPDVVVEQTLDDVTGKTDSILEQGLSCLKKAN